MNFLTSTASQSCFKCQGDGQLYPYAEKRGIPKTCDSCNGSKVIQGTYLCCHWCQGEGKEYPFANKQGIPQACGICNGKGYLTEKWTICSDCSGGGKTYSLPNRGGVATKCTKCSGKGGFPMVTMLNQDGLSSNQGFTGGSSNTGFVSQGGSSTTSQGFVNQGGISNTGFVSQGGTSTTSPGFVSQGGTSTTSPGFVSQGGTSTTSQGFVNQGGISNTGFVNQGQGGFTQDLTNQGTTTNQAFVNQTGFSSNQPFCNQGSTTTDQMFTNQMLTNQTSNNQEFVNQGISNTNTNTNQMFTNQAISTNTNTTTQPFTGQTFDYPSFTQNINIGLDTGMNFGGFTQPTSNISTVHEHPLSKSYKSYICDLCGVTYTNNISNGCTICEMDVCEECYSMINASQTQNTQSHNHTLKPTRTPLGFRCNLCMQTYGKKLVSWCCSACNVDLCVKCYWKPKPLVNNMTLVHPHQMVLAVGSYTCDFCGNQYTRQNGYGCRMCNMDMCVNCVTYVTNSKANVSNFNLRHFHPLLVEKRKKNWHCDQCRNSFPLNRYSWYCSLCDFDLCLGCYWK